MADGTPAVTLETLHGDFADLKATMISGFRGLPTRESGEEMVRLLRESNRLQEERFAQVDGRLRDQHFETQQTLHALVVGQRQLVDGQRQLVDGQRQLVEGQRQLVEGQRQLVEGQQRLVEGQQGLIESQQRLMGAQHLLLEGQRSLSAEVQAATAAIRSLVARIDALIRGRGNGEPHV